MHSAAHKLLDLGGRDPQPGGVADPQCWPIDLVVDMDESVEPSYMRRICRSACSKSSPRPSGVPLNYAAKNCTGDGSATLKRWLGKRDVLFLIDQRREPLVLVR